MMCVCYFWFVLYVGCANVGVEYLCGVCVCVVFVCVVRASFVHAL